VTSFLLSAGLLWGCPGPTRHRGTGEFAEGNLRSVDPQAPLSPLATPLTASAVPRPPGKTRLSHGNPPPSGVGRKSTAVPAATRWPSPSTPSPRPPRPPRPYPATMPTRTSPPAALVRCGTCQHHPSTSGAATLPLTQRAPAAVVADIRAKLAAIRRQKAS